MFGNVILSVAPLDVAILSENIASVLIGFVIVVTITALNIKMTIIKGIESVTIRHKRDDSGSVNFAIDVCDTTPHEATGTYA